MRAGRNTNECFGQCDILVAWPAEHVLVFHPALGKRIKTEFCYDSRKGVGACDRRPSGLGEDDQPPPLTQDGALEM